MIPDVTIVYRLGDKAEQVDFRKVPLEAWTDIKSETGLTPKTILDELSDLDVGAIVGLVYAARRQKGGRVTFRQVMRQLDGDTEWVPTKVTVAGQVQFDDTEESDEVVDEDPTSGQ